MNKNTKKFEGSPSTIGADVFIYLAMPSIHEASKRLNGNDLALLYGGFFGAFYGALCADFGQTTGEAILKHLTKELGQMERLEPQETLQ